MWIKLFSWFWKSWLYDGFTGKYSKVIKIKGWRTALIETPFGLRYTTTFIPKWTLEYWQGKKENKW